MAMKNDGVKAEMNAKHSFEMLKQSLENTIAQDSKELAEAKSGQIVWAERLEDEVQGILSGEQILIERVESERIAAGLHRVWVTIENTRIIPTRSAQDVKNRISPPDLVTAKGAGLEVLSAGRVLDADFKRVEPVNRRPERVELATVPGMSAERVQFIVAGSGTLRIGVESAKGGVHETTIRLR